MYEPFLVLTMPLSATREKEILVNLPRVLCVEPVGSGNIPLKQPTMGSLEGARSILWMNVAGETIAVKETRDEIAQAAIEIARRVSAGGGSPVPTIPASGAVPDLSLKRGVI